MSGKDFEGTLKDVIVEVVNTFGPISFDGLVATVLQLFFLDDDNCYTSFAEHEDVGWATVALVVEEKILCDSDELLEGHNILSMPPREQIDMEPIKVVELFAGIGAIRKALTRLGIPHTSVISEIDKFAVKSYNAIHGDTPNLGDVTGIDALPDCDLLTYSFPCQDLSIAGNRAGMADGSDTRSSLLWEVGRLLADSPTKPEYLLMENVDAILHKANAPDFRRWIRQLSKMGYTSSYEILNACDYGVPQSRKRCFMVSHLGHGRFRFPAPRPNHLVLGDLLEAEVDGKYFLSAERMENYEKHRIRHANTHPDKTPTLPLILDGTLADMGFDMASRVYSPSGVSPTIRGVNGGNNQPKIIEGERERIRYLTPRECWRLQGFPDWAFDAVADLGTSDAQLYKMAGNTIAVPCLQAIFEGMFMMKTWVKSPSLFDFGVLT